jgi:hypothetical protein
MASSNLHMQVSFYSLRTKLTASGHAAILTEASSNDPEPSDFVFIPTPRTSNWKVWWVLQFCKEFFASQTESSLERFYLQAWAWVDYSSKASKPIACPPCQSINELRDHFSAARNHGIDFEHSLFSSIFAREKKICWASLILFCSPIIRLSDIWNDKPSLFPLINVYSEIHWLFFQLFFAIITRNYTSDSPWIFSNAKKYKCFTWARHLGRLR